jgi:hypothetical protein
MTKIPLENRESNCAVVLHREDKEQLNRIEDMLKQLIGD